MLTKRFAVGVFAAGITVAMLAASCGGGDDDDGDLTGPATVTATATASAETPPTLTGTPTADPTPAPGSGEGRFELAFPQLPLARPIELVEVPGQGILLVALQEGIIVGFSKDGDGSDRFEVTNIRSRVSRAGNEEGLLGMALDPAFEENGYVYLHYSVATGERRGRLARFETTGEGAELRLATGSELVILEVPQPYANHNGGKVAFGPDGMLYISLGDGGSGGDPQGNGQDLTRTLLGSILRIDVSDASEAEPYRIPADNPWADGAGGALPEYWAYGLRNTWKFSFDRQTGTLWAADVGQGRMEEVNIIERGGNYGWNIMEGSECYLATTCEQEGLILPVAEYTHQFGCSVTGGVVYRGSAVPEMYGWYLYGDYCSGRMWALEAGAVEGGARVEPKVISDGGPQVAAFAEDLDGELYMLSFDLRIYRLVVD